MDLRLREMWKGKSWEAPNQTSQWRRWTRRLGAEGDVFRLCLSKLKLSWQSAAGDGSGFRLCCELALILCTGKAAPLGKRGQYRQWQRSTPAKKGTKEFGTRKHQGGVGSDCQSSHCVSDCNRNCQGSLRASRRRQQVVKCLNLCENSCLGVNIGAKSARELLVHIWLVQVTAGNLF